MRSYSLFTILLLCLAIFLIDLAAFYWLQSITQFIPSKGLKLAINIAFWVFTIGLITAIIILKVKLDDINPTRKHLLISSFYGLTVSSFIPKLIFVIVISVLYFTNFMFSETESLIIVPIVGLFSGFLPFFVIAYAVFKAIYHFKIYHKNIKFNHLPTAFNAFRIVQISDLHLGNFNYRYNILERAVKLINNLKPDLIFFTGDLVNNYEWELRGWQEVLEKLEAKHGKFAVLGNHDYGDYSQWETKKNKQDNFENIKDFFNKINFKLLLNDSEILEKDNNKIAIVGVENWGNPPFKQYGDLKKALVSSQNTPFKILLTHDPSHWQKEVIEQTDIALTFSGHTHGMQAAINVGKKQWSPIKYKFEHWAGLYKIGQQYLYVNRGLGWLGFPGRLGMRPEITLLTLECTN
ncbi:MAG: metallophosphoesterase [Winogradskyella sp.]|uniref:metallophosphoesterase n=1 Tax=Winogradskyella sp. TaxID=1883156 RepID=UPI00180A756E|nr:metallophosphoesterase [Winogradskyella sp.]MBT8244446.1 metallophosphoesterase [Winogradskyella sp.]NNK22398.1 metallophosphoesterase [Winogradskyella sp.]